MRTIMVLCSVIIAGSIDIDFCASRAVFICLLAAIAFVWDMVGEFRTHSLNRVKP